MGGGHNTHASGISKRKGTESNSRASRGKSTDNFSCAAVVLAGKTDVTTYADDGRGAAPSEAEVIAVRRRAESASLLRVRTFSLVAPLPYSRSPQGLLRHKVRATKA